MTAGEREASSRRELRLIPMDFCKRETMLPSCEVVAR